MKATNLKITDLIYALEQFLDAGIKYLDAEVLPSKNILKFSNSSFEEDIQTEIPSA